MRRGMNEKCSELPTPAVPAGNIPDTVGIPAHVMETQLE